MKADHEAARERAEKYLKYNPSGGDYNMFRAYIEHCERIAELEKEVRFRTNLAQTHLFDLDATEKRCARLESELARACQQHEGAASKLWDSEQESHRRATLLREWLNTELDSQDEEYQSWIDDFTVRVQAELAPTIAAERKPLTAAHPPCTGASETASAAPQTAAEQALQGTPDENASETSQPAPAAPDYDQLATAQEAGECSTEPNEISSPAPAATIPCQWTEESEGSPWYTDCGYTFRLEEDGPNNNGMKFCCYCGRPLIEVPYVEDE